MAETKPNVSVITIKVSRFNFKVKGHRLSDLIENIQIHDFETPQHEVAGRLKEKGC